MMKQIFLSIIFIFTYSCLQAENWKAFFEKAEVPFQTGEAQILNPGMRVFAIKVGARWGLCGEFNLNLLSRAKWQPIVELNHYPETSVKGIAIEGWRVRDGNFYKKGSELIIKKYNSKFGPTTNQINVKYDYTGDKPDEHYRIYCSKVYDNGNQEYINCNDIFSIEHKSHNARCGYRAIQDYGPLGLHRSWHQ